MNILVIGGSGFIGTALIRELLTFGYYVRNFDKNPGVDFSEFSITGDVRDQGALNGALKDIDVVFNLAAEHRDDVTPVTLYYDVNVQGARNIVEAAELNNVKRIIFTSTVAVYGLNKNEPDENISYIIIDGGSTDGTVGVIKNFGLKIKGFLIIYNNCIL